MADRRDIERLLQDLEQQPGLPKGAARDIREASIATRTSELMSRTPAACKTLGRK